MSTQHLSISVTAYDDGEWSVALVRTTTHPGKPLTREQLLTRRCDGDTVRRDVLGALEYMMRVDRVRVESERRPAESTPAAPPGRR